MHELSIAHEVVATVGTVVGDVRVRAVTLRVGVFAGVVPQSLQFCWDLATTGTLLDGSVLVIERVPVPVTCLDCGLVALTSALPPLSCPGCDGVVLPAAGGRELEISTVEVDDVDEVDDVVDVEGAVEA